MELITNSTCYWCGAINPWRNGLWCYKCTCFKDGTREIELDRRRKQALGNKNWHPPKGG